MSVSVTKYKEGNFAIVDLVEIKIKNPGNAGVLSTKDIEVKPLHYLAIKRRDGDIYHYHSEIKLKKVLNPKDINLQDKSFYRFPKLDLPRIKTDILKDKYNISITRSAEKADYKIISSKGLQNTYNWCGCRKVCTYADLLPYLDKIKPLVTIEAYQKILDGISGVQLVCVDVEYNYRVDNPNKYKTFRAHPSKDDVWDLTKHNFIHPEKIKWHSLHDKESLLSMVFADNLVYDHDLVKVCNEDSVVLDEEQFTSILGMVKSGDKENISVALEVMANCNVDESKAALGYIYAFYQYALKEAKNWNHANVKTMRKALGHYEVYGRRDNGNIYSQFINKCLKNDSLNEMVFKIIAQDVFKHVIQHNFNDNCPFDFKIEDVRLKPDIKYQESDLPF